MTTSAVSCSTSACAIRANQRGRDAELSEPEPQEALGPTGDRAGSSVASTGRCCGRASRSPGAPASSVAAVISAREARWGRGDRQDLRGRSARQTRGWRRCGWR